MTRCAPAAGERVQVQRQAGDERLALTGLHLGDVAFVKDDSAHQLHVEHPLIRLADASLANGRERLEQDLVERLAVLDAKPEIGRLGAQVRVGERLELGLQRGRVRTRPAAAASGGGPRRRGGPFRGGRSSRSAWGKGSGFTVRHSSERIRRLGAAQSGATEYSQSGPSRRGARTTQASWRSEAMRSSAGTLPSVGSPSTRIARSPSFHGARAPPARVGVELDHLDAPCPHGPEVVMPDGRRPVRRLALALERICERRQVGIVLAASITPISRRG